MSGDPGESQELFLWRIESAQAGAAKQGSSSSFYKSPSCKTREIPSDGSGSGSNVQPAPTATRMLMCIRERERRRSFKALLADLMAVLPTDALQGKKYLADRIVGVADYVGMLQKRISQLSEGSQEIKHLYTYANYHGRNTNTQSCYKPSAVEVRRIGPCLEVSIRVSKGRILPSEIFLLLENHGLHTVTAYSSEIGSDQMLHVILTKSTDVVPVNLREALLQSLVVRAPYRPNSTVEHSAFATFS